MKKPKLPEMVKYAGCGENLVVEKYLSGFPPADVPDKIITWRVVPQGAPTYVLFCACGQYTDNSYFERSRR